jgi:hypothetical protein
MFYEARLTCKNGAVTIGRGEKDADAVNAALADSPSTQITNPSQIVLAVYRCAENHRDLAYATTLSKYRLDTK